MKRTIILILLPALFASSISAQCFLDRHNTSWHDGWISCTTSLNPNPARGESHWILYEFDYSYTLFQLHLWNTNAPDYLNYGMQDIAIDISNDGINWTAVGEFQLPMADGTSTYEGLDLYDFGGINAQYVLITGLTNHGGACFGLSEIRIDVADEIVIINDNKEEGLPAGCLSARIFPNPVNEASKAVISSTCSDAPIYYSIQDVSGKTIKSGVLRLVSDEVELALNGLPIVSGMYVLSVRQQGLARRFKIVKVE